MAFPWTKQVAAYMSLLLRADHPKIASNLKFEERWTCAILGHGVNNWQWDTMQAAHVLDNRQEICSIKFQAYARLGFPLYDGSVGKFLYAPSSNAPNRINRADFGELLKYNSLDSLLEYKVAQLQMRDLKHGTVS